MAKGDSAAPQYKERPEVSQSISWLLEQGKKMFGGEWPDWLKPVGEVYPEGAQFAMKRGTQFAKEEASKRGGLGSSALVSKIADIAKQVQMSDWYRAMTGRQWGAEMGSGMVKSGGGMGLTRETTQYAGDVQAWQAEQERAAAERAAMWKGFGQLGGAALSFLPFGKSVGQYAPVKT